MEIMYESWNQPAQQGQPRVNCDRPTGQGDSTPPRSTWRPLTELSGPWLEVCQKSFADRSYSRRNSGDDSLSVGGSRVPPVTKSCIATACTARRMAQGLKGAASDPLFTARGGVTRSQEEHVRIAAACRSGFPYSVRTKTRRTGRYHGVSRIRCDALFEYRIYVHRKMPTGQVPAGRRC
jgi:hypothetical protein